MPDFGFGRLDLPRGVAWISPPRVGGGGEVCAPPLPKHRQCHRANFRDAPQIQNSSSRPRLALASRGLPSGPPPPQRPQQAPRPRPPPTPPSYAPSSHQRSRTRQPRPQATSKPRFRALARDIQTALEGAHTPHARGELRQRSIWREKPSWSLVAFISLSLGLSSPSLA